MRRHSTLALALAAAAASVFGQVPPTKLNAVGTDPFDIGPNRSFFASRGASEIVGGPAAASKEVGRIVSDLSEALNIIRTQHSNGERMDVGAISKSAIEGALQALDPHSNYFDSSEYREFLEEQQSEYSGIGATIGSFRRNGHSEPYVISTVPGSPAAAAKLGYGDRILKVDGADCEDRSADEVRDAVRGDAGTRLRLTVEKASSGLIETVELRRRVVPLPSIKDAFVLPGGVGYIAMTEGFNYTTADELSASLRKLHQQHISGLIVDLRENPGGILEQAVLVAEKFLPYGSVIVSQRGRSNIDNRVWRSSDRNPETLPLVLLVNENSASASEIVAGALQDHDRALIVGERTFGKGLVQSLYDVPYGAGLTLTTARYYTPSGRSIQRNYSGSSLYDYYNHRLAIQPESRIESKTSAHRVVFGGDGIEPDTLSRSAEQTSLQMDLADLAFFFARDVVYKRSAQNSFHRSNYIADRSAWIDSLVNDALVTEFTNFAVASSAGAISLDSIKNEKTFVVERLKFELALAWQGDAGANRVFLANDLPVLTALSQLPRARELARASLSSH